MGCGQEGFRADVGGVDHKRLEIGRFMRQGCKYLLENPDL